MNGAADCTVLIAAPDLLLTLKERSQGDDSELLAFSDTEALRALEVISRRRPRIVALERMFAATPRGAALINRIKADPTLTQSEIRVVTHAAEFARAPSPGGSLCAAVASAPGAPLDQRGTRLAQRYKIAPKVEADVNGNSATIVDLSTVGVQVVSATILKPNQKLRVTFSDDQATVRCNAVVAWASFEIPPKGGPRYRAGIELLDANADALDAFRARHQAS